jgi:hypothetical protein
MTYGVLVVGGEIKPQFAFSPDDKAAVCNMYLDDKSPADPVGIQNFSAKVAEAMSIEQGLVAPGTPRVPDVAIPLWAARETSPAVFFTKFCKFVGAFDPDTSLTITLNGTDENSSAQSAAERFFWHASRK